MNFIGIDPHTNRFTCCYRNERSSVDNPRDKRVQTFELTESGTAEFFETLTGDTHVLIEATVTTFSFARLFRDQVQEVLIANTCELNKNHTSFLSLEKYNFHPTFTGNEPPRGKPRGIWNVGQFLDRRLVREEIYNTVWFNTEFLKLLCCLNRGKPRGIKPDFRIKCNKIIKSIPCLQLSSRQRYNNGKVDPLSFFR